jgi:DNA-binding MarR family transcriptional regulator
MHPDDKASLGLLVRLLDLKLARASAAMLADSSVSLAEMSALRMIADQPGIRPGAIAEALAIKPPNLTRLINRLELAGLCTRSGGDEDDERAVLLRLTPQGEKMVALGRKVADAVEARALARLPAETRALFLHCLRTILTDPVESADAEPAAVQAVRQPRTKQPGR